MRFTYDDSTGRITLRDELSVRSRVDMDWCLGDVLEYLDLDGLSDEVLASFDDDASVGDVKLNFDETGQLVSIQILGDLPASLLELAERV